MTESEYLDWLREGSHYEMVSATGDGRWVAIREMYLCADILRGAIGDMAGHADVWRYPDSWSAAYAMGLWARVGYEGEPEGWIRHSPSERRRPVRRGRPG